MRLKIKSMIYVLLVHPQRVLRSSHTINDESYINWLEKIEKKKEQIEKDHGTYDLIQLSRTGPKYNLDILISAHYFWEC